ncbi:MAG: CobW family GTP-binding protein [bacterium]|jgi:G3E family GTPase|nr:GTP-binding protein [Betaproteobacteria bacterium]
MNAAAKIPVSVITGFLGSGKTTLLGKLLRHPGMNRVAVIINEFGEQSIDHDLVQTSSEQMMVLDNGCLCCRVRGDLQETLVDLWMKRRNGETIDFNRVVIETTGLADPAPVIHTMITDTSVCNTYTLDAIITLVDAVNGNEQLDTLEEPVKQAAVADRLVITKTDLADPAEVERLEARLRELNPHAAIVRCVMGDLDPSFLVDVGVRHREASEKAIENWLGSESFAPVVGAGAASAIPGGRLVGGAPPRKLPKGQHTAGVDSFCLYYDKPFSWKTFSVAMEVLTSLRGPDLLRVKGLLDIEGEPGPVVVQGVQHLFHPPVTLDAWPSDDHRSRLVFITRNIPRAMIENLVGAILATAASAPAVPAGADASLAS